MAALSKFEKAKIHIGLKHCFFATLMMMTPHIMDRSVKTACTDMKEIRYNPDWLDAQTFAVVVGVILHEAGHILLKHGLRRGNRDPHLWNIACDHAVNLMLLEAGIELWDRHYADPRFKGMSAEAIYAALAREEAGKPQPQPQGQPAPGSAPPSPYAHLPSDPMLGDDVQEPAPSAQPEIEEKVNDMVQRATAVGRMAGNLPGDLARLLGTYFDPPLRWEDHYAEYMLRKAADRTNWGVRNRRFSDVFLPSRKSTRMGPVIIIGDTSGSVTDATFAMIATQTNYITETCKPESIRLIWCDRVVKGEQLFEEGEDVVLKPEGGGGTDMRVGLKHAEQYDPDVVVLITDGETPWPTSVPYPLIVLCTTSINVPIGEVVRVQVS